MSLPTEDAALPEGAAMDSFGWTLWAGHSVLWTDGTVTPITDREHALIVAAYRLGVHHTNLTERT